MRGPAKLCTAPEGSEAAAAAATAAACLTPRGSPQPRPSYPAPRNARAAAGWRPRPTRMAGRTLRMVAAAWLPLPPLSLPLPEAPAVPHNHTGARCHPPELSLPSRGCSRRPPAAERVRDTDRERHGEGGETERQREEGETESREGGGGGGGGGRDRWSNREWREEEPGCSTA